MPRCFPRCFSIYVDTSGGFGGPGKIKCDIMSGNVGEGYKTRRGCWGWETALTGAY